MRKISTGDDATLSNYRKLCALFFGEDSGPVKFLDDKIASDPKGGAAEVIQDETQMMALFASLL